MRFLVPLLALCSVMVVSPFSSKPSSTERQVQDSDVEFSASPFGSAAVRLTWKDKAGQTAAGYEIERHHRDGAFQSIGFVPAHIEGSRSAYQFVDTPEAREQHFYRVRRIASDAAKEQITRAVPVQLDRAAAAIEIRAERTDQAEARITCSASRACEAELAIVTSAGVPVRSLGVRSLTSKEIEIRFDGRDSAGELLPDGQYFVEVKTEAGRQTTPLPLR